MSTKKGKPSFTNCSPGDVFRAARKLGGFEIKERGGAHNKITHIRTGKPFPVPRKKIVNKNIMKGFVEEYLIEALGFSEKEIYKHLWC